MKEDYAYDFPESGDGSILGCVLTLVWCVWFFICMLIATKTDDRGAGIVLGVFLAFLPLFIFIIILETSMASFTADDHAVTFRYLLKKTVIPYENIKSIEVKAEYREQSIRGEVNRYYAEVISFHCDGEQEYVFGGKLKTYFELILKDPSYLQKQIEDSKFSQLKRYIEGQMK